VFTKYGIHTLTDLVIANPMRVYLFSQLCATQKFAIFDATQAIKKGFHDQHLIDQFFLLTIEYLNVYTNRLMCPYIIVSMPCEASKG
jgi:hypothetical protein